MINLDEHGQPAERWLNASRLANRSVDELIGMCKGFLADAVLNTDEVNFLARWLEANYAFINQWPVNILTERIIEILSDGIVDEGEKGELFNLLNDITGGTKAFFDKYQNNSTTLPLCKPAPDIIYTGKIFCFTGKFLYGTRSRCQKEITTRGGLTQEQPTQKTSYMIIGNLGSSDWAHTTHGRKIEAAVEIKKKGLPLSIVSEEHWMRFL